MEVAVEESVSSIPVTKFFSKAWWNAELAQSHKSREQAYKKYRRRKSSQNLIYWKKLRAVHQRSVARYKKEQWQAMAESINKDTLLSKVWNTIRRIRGKPKFIF